MTIVARSLFIVLAASLALCAGAATYKWVDKDGKVHYSDSPVAGAEKIELKPLTEIQSTPVGAEPQSDASSGSPMDKPTQYTSMVITSPTPGEAVRTTGAGFTIAVDLQPGLGGDDRIEYLLDGAPVSQRIEHLDRGTHTVIARVRTPDDAIKISAAPVTFSMLQVVVARPTPPKPPKK